VFDHIYACLPHLSRRDFSISVTPRLQSCDSTHSCMRHDSYLQNAWNMNLLDHIRGLASSAETDFVTAGCTLDAAGKIYS